MHIDILLYVKWKHAAWPVKGDTEDFNKLYYDNQPIAHLLI